MYARPELDDAHAALWVMMRDELRAQGVNVPDALSLGEDLEFWRRDDLVFSQTCGMPLREHLHSDVAYLATPDYGLPDCKPGYYNSVFIAKDPGKLTDFDGARFALNGTNSQSGFAAPITAANIAGIEFSTGIVSGGHRNSYQAVKDGYADVAAIDAMTWHYINRLESPDVHIIGYTAQTPTLPYICSKSMPRAKILTALKNAIAGLSGHDRDLLRLRELVEIPLTDYLAVKTPDVPFPLVTL
jgi:ABC-type phosphate/phosphonate transport system substrate-binding protein